MGSSKSGVDYEAQRAAAEKTANAAAAERGDKDATGGKAKLAEKVKGALSKAKDDSGDEQAKSGFGKKVFSIGK